jgi:hypothetical protein
LSTVSGVLRQNEQAMLGDNSLVAM